MPTRMLVSLTLCLALSAQTLALEVGDQAPVLDGVTWLQGEEVEGYEAGQIYVLDFWATWCGPCIQSIPHLNSLQEEYGDDGVNIIGVAVWPRPGMVPTRTFLTRRAESGKALEYRIAEDNRAGVIVNRFLRPAGINGIPTAMVIDGSGRIVFIGHPMNDLEGVLEQLVEGTFSLEAYKKKQDERERALARSRELMSEFQKAYQAEDVDKQLEITAELVELSPEMFGNVATLHYLLLVDKKGEAQRAKAYAERMLSDVLADEAVHLSTFAWQIAMNEDLAEAERDLDLALRFAERATQITDAQDANILDTLARVHFVRGEFKKAVEVQRRAVDLAPDGDFRDALVENLQEFKEATGEAG